MQRLLFVVTIRYKLQYRLELIGGLITIEAKLQLSIFTIEEEGRGKVNPYLLREAALGIFRTIKIGHALLAMNINGDHIEMLASVVSNLALTKISLH